jgi:hypothetical protein
MMTRTEWRAEDDHGRMPDTSSRRHRYVNCKCGWEKLVHGSDARATKEFFHHLKVVGLIRRNADAHS